jgi:hypothetical protein
MYVSTNTASSMEEATADAVNATVATLVDKAVTRAMENASNEAVEREVQERVHAIEDHFAAAVDKAVEEIVKVIKETMQKKIDRASRMAELQANIDMVCLFNRELNKILTRACQAHLAQDDREESRTKFGPGNSDQNLWVLDKAIKAWENVVSWSSTLTELRKQDEEQL